jgi:putative transposase
MQGRIDAFAKRWRDSYPAAMRCLLDDRESLVVYLRFPRLSLVWSVLDRASTGWRGFTMTPVGLRLLQDLRRTLHDPPAQLPQRDSTQHADAGAALTDPVAVA